MTQSASSRRDAPAARAPAPVTVGRWRLLEPIGGGRCSRVFLARPAGVPDDWPSDYVVKLSRAAVDGAVDRDDDAIDRLLLQREAFVGRQVSHPHLMSILAAHVDAPPYYLVMPHLPGRTIAQRLAHGARYSIADALWIARQAAEALAALHAAHWRHGDVKPGNILLAATGHATLIDLGFAQRIEQNRYEETPLSGTPAYAAPEVLCAAAAIDGRADVYSLGVALYEMLVGRRPFLDDEPARLAAAHLHQMAPDPRRFLPTIPLGVSRLMRRMLAKEPLRRPSAAEVSDLLVRLEIENFEMRDWAASGEFGVCGV